MRSETLSSKCGGWFNPTLFWKNVTRFSPIWAVYTALWFFLMPMEVLLIQERKLGDLDLARRVSDQIAGCFESGVWVAVIFGLMAGMALFSYLMNNRSVGMFHALPIRREGLFLTNWLSGVAFFLVPNAVIALLTLGAEAVVGSFQPGAVLLWLVIQTLLCVFFFSFAVFCAMFTGNLLALPVFYGIVNALVIVVSLLLDTTLELLLVGYSDSLANATLVRWLTPAYHLANMLNSRWVPAWEPDEYDRVRQLNSVRQLNCPAGAIGYCLVGAVFFALAALAIYRLRQLERAGDLVTVGWVRPVFQYGLGVCGGLGLGCILYYNFFDRFGAPVFVALVAVCGVICCFAGRMLLKKTLKVFTDGWKGCAALGLCLALLLAGARMDFFGFQRRVPDPGKVEEVYLTHVDTMPYDHAAGGGVSFTDPALIDAAVQLHSVIVQDLDALRAVEDGGGIYRWDTDGVQDSGTIGLKLIYTMKDGGRMVRQYSGIPVSAGDLTDPATAGARLQALVNKPEVIIDSYGLTLKETAVGGTFDGEDEEGRWREMDLTADQAARLWEAVKEDLTAGRYHRYLLDDRERQENCYITDLNLTLTWKEEGAKDTTVRDLRVTPQKSATSTMKALEELDLLQYFRERAVGSERAEDLSTSVAPVATEVMG